MRSRRWVLVKSTPMGRDRFQRGRLEKVGRKFRGHYYVYEFADGVETRRHRSITFADGVGRAEAKTKLQALIAANTKQAPRDTGRMTLRQFWEERYLPMRGPTWKPSSKPKTIHFVTRRILERFGDRELRSLTRFELQQYINETAAAGASGSAVTKIRVYLHAILDEALEQGLIDKDPARRLDIPRCRKPDRPVLTPEQFRAIVAAMSERDALIMRCMLVLALRPGELFALRVDDLGDDWVRVDESATPEGVLEPKTAGSISRVACPAELMRELRRWCGDAEARRFVFPSRAGTPIASHNFLRRVLREAVVVARDHCELPSRVNLQMLRRCAATWMQGGNPKDAQTHLRHSSPILTQAVYVQAVPSSVMAAASELYKKATR